MTTYGRRNSAKQWARLAMKVGLFLTDAKLWSAVSQQLNDRASDVGDAMRDTYEETASRLSNARSAIRGETQWVGPVTGFLSGVGIGVAVGMLMAPVSGEEARAVIRDRAAEMKDRVSDFATRSSRFRTGAVSTGTDGD